MVTSPSAGKSDVCIKGSNGLFSCKLRSDFHVHFLICTHCHFISSTWVLYLFLRPPGVFIPTAQAGPLRTPAQFSPRQSFSVTVHPQVSQEPFSEAGYCLPGGQAFLSPSPAAVLAFCSTAILADTSTSSFIWLGTLLSDCLLCF